MSTPTSDHQKQVAENISSLLDFDKHAEIIEAKYRAAQKQLQGWGV